MGHAYYQMTTYEHSKVLMLWTPSTSSNFVIVDAIDCEYLSSWKFPDNLEQDK
jgi:hypothetical protein